MNKFNMFIITSVLTAGTMIILGMTVGNVTIQHASAQLPDKDNGSSTYVPGQNRSSIAGGWMPMERPGWDPNDAPENNPRQSGQESGINGCLSSNCTSK